MNSASEPPIQAPETPKAGVTFLRLILRSVYYPALLLVLAWGVGWTVLLYQTLVPTEQGDVLMGWLMWHHLESAALWVLGRAARSSRRPRPTRAAARGSKHCAG